MANIYELTDEFRTLWALMEEGTIDDEVLAEVFQCTAEELAIKLEGYCKFIKNVEGDIEALKNEEKRLHERRQSLENTVDRAKGAMKAAMLAAGERSLACGTFKVGIQKSPPKVIIDDPYIENVPARYLVQQEPTINKKLILEDFKNDGIIPDLEGIAHIEQDDSIRIR